MTEPKEAVAASVAEAEGATRPAPKSAEDAKAAKALESMEGKGDEEVKGASAEDLGNASKVLSTKRAAPASKPTTTTTKVDAADVAEVVEQMEVSKVKATELLRSAGGNLTEALRKMIRCEY